MPRLINEDEALRDALKGMVVSDEKNATRPVMVYYSQPDTEVRAQNYPYMTIDLVDISPDPQRQISGFMTPPYLPEGWPALPNGQAYVTETPIPLSLDYMVTAFSRHPRHSREIHNQMFFKFPWKFGRIYVPQDDTIRPAFLTQFRVANEVEINKRLFRSIYTIRVFSEMYRAMAHTIGQALEVDLTIPEVDINFSVTQTGTSV